MMDVEDGKDEFPQHSHISRAGENRQTDRRRDRQTDIHRRRISSVSLFRSSCVGLYFVESVVVPRVGHANPSWWLPGM